MEAARPIFVNSTEASAAETGIEKGKERESGRGATANRAGRGRSRERRCLLRESKEEEGGDYVGRG